MERQYILFAGVDGAGKSAFYQKLRSQKGDWRSIDDQAAAMKEARPIASFERGVLVDGDYFKCVWLGEFGVGN